MPRLPVCHHSRISSILSGGNITDSCLEQDRKKIMEDFFEEMYFTGEIKESTFDNKDIPMNVDSKGNEVPRSNDISRENRHRAKL